MPVLVLINSAGMEENSSYLSEKSNKEQISLQNRNFNHHQVPYVYWLLSADSEQSEQDQKALLLPVLCIVGFIYIGMLIGLGDIAVKIKNDRHIDESNKGTNSRRMGDTMLCTYVAFLYVTIFLRTLTIAILVFFLMGLADSHDLPLKAIFIIYNTSLINLCIVFAIALYQWVFIVHRINLYSGFLKIENFRNRLKVSKILYTLVISGTFGTNLILMVVEAFKPEVGISTAVSSTILFELSALLLCFIIVGSIMIRRLKVYFQDNYRLQRFYLLISMLLFILSLSIMVTRYALEYVFNVTGSHATHAQPKYLPVKYAVPIIVISDIMPLAVQILFIWMSRKGNTDYLVAGFLYAPSPSEKSTIVASDAFQHLYEEQESMFEQVSKSESSCVSFPSMLLESDVIMSLDRSRANLKFGQSQRDAKNDYFQAPLVQYQSSPRIQTVTHQSAHSFETKGKFSLLHRPTLLKQNSEAHEVTEKFKASPTKTLDFSDDCESSEL